MSSIRNCDPELKSYLLGNRLTVLFESLITALAINRPDDYIQFVLDKIKLLLEDRNLFESLQWDTFIDEDKKPVIPLGSKVYDFVWSYEDENMQPTYEMYEKAYSFYNHKWMRMCISAMKEYWLYKIEKRRQLEIQFAYARGFYKERLLRKHFGAFLVVIRAQKEKERMFIKKVRSVIDLSIARLVFEAWKHVAMDSRRTREYFEKIEKGELPGRGDDNLTGRDHISSFPAKVAIMVFSYIDLPDLITCSQVCRKWKMITQASALWSRIDLTKVTKQISGKAVGSLIHKCRPFLCHLNLRGMAAISAKSLQTVGECRNLQDLNLSGCKGVTADVIKEIAVGCASLLYLNLSHCYLTDAGLRSLSRSCSNIQFLNLSFCVDFTNKGLQYLASGKGARRLIYLDLSGCHQITGSGFLELGMGCHRLNALSLEHLPNLKDDHLQALMTGCKSLRYVSILHSTLLTDVAIKSISQSKRLQVMKLEGNNRITDSAIRSLVRSCPDLRHLYLAECQRLTDLSLKALGFCKNLTVANVADCVRLSDTGLRYIVEGHSGPKLRELNLTNCLRVSDVSVLRIVQRCTTLTYINLSYCEHVTDAGVELLGMIPSLISVDISGCFVQDQGISALGNNPKLKDIIIAECINVSDIGMQKLVQHTRDLENLDVSECKLLTDHSIKSLAFCCRRLRTLNISGCRLLSDQSLQYLSGVSHYLDSLDFSGCNLISDKALRFLRKGCRNLKYLSMRNCRGVSKAMILRMGSKIENVLHDCDDIATYEKSNVSYPNQKKVY